MKRKMTNFLIWLYREKTQTYGRSPLDIPSKSVIISLLFAVGFGALAGNVFLSILYNSAQRELSTSEIKFPAFKSGTDHITAKVKEILPSDLHDQLRGKSFSDVEGVENLLAGERINFIDVVEWVRFIQPDMDVVNLEQQIMGKLALTMGFVQLYQVQSIKEILSSEYGLSAPPTDPDYQLQEEDWTYNLLLSLMSEYRDRLQGSYARPLRLLAALAGGIQWLTFSLAVWGFVLLILRLAWANLNIDLTVSGYMTEEEHINIWNIEQADPEKPLDIIRFSRKYTQLFPVVTLIEETLKADRTEHSELEIWVDSKLTIAREKVGEGEWEYIDYILYAIPTFAFLGTILGITLAMGAADEIIKARDKFEEILAIEEVTSKLGLAFDTSFVGLLAVVILSWFAAHTRKREARLWAVIDKEVNQKLKWFWYEIRDRKKEVPDA